MDCHSTCAACCEVIHISSALPGLEKGKAAGVRCINLNKDNLCEVYDERPAVCREFMPSKDFCGDCKKDAYRILAEIEEETGF